MPAPSLSPEATLAEVRTALGDAARHVIELRNVPEDKRGDGHTEDVRQALEFLQQADAVEHALAAEERGRQPEQPEARGGRSVATDLRVENRSLGAQVTEAEGYDDWAANGRRGGPFSTEVRNLIGGFTAGAYDSDSHLWLPVGSPSMVAGSQQRRRPFVRDLMSVQGTGLRVIPYLREANQVTNETGAQMVSEGSAKPEVTMTFQAYNAVVEKIAAWLPVTEEIVTDAPTLRGYIDTRLEYMLMIREEQQVLAGTGTSPQIEGLATVTGTQDQTTVSGGGTGNAGDYTMTVGAAIGKIENVDGDADGVVSNPLDYWKAATARHANQFDNGFGSGAPGSQSNITWGLPVVRTRALTAGTTWVGAWALGSTLFDRQQTMIKVGDQHSDNFVKNILVVLAEKRIAVAWHRPNLFVECVVPIGT